MRIGSFLAAAFLALGSCSSHPAEPPDYPTLPDDDPSEKGATEAGQTPEPSGSAARVRCIPAGDYQVSFDLSAAQITQKNTGMDSLEWCRSVLEGVAVQSMSRMRIQYPGGQLAVDWPNRVRVKSTDDCSFEVTSLAVLSRVRFAGGKGTGTSSYSVGTPNHPDERCTAKGVALTIAPAAQP